jgi:hypothetical protein
VRDVKVAEVKWKEDRKVGEGMGIGCCKCGFFDL